MVAGCFLFHTLRFLPGIVVNDGGHTAGDPVVPEDIHAGISLLFQDIVDLVDAKGFPGFRALACGIEQADDLRDGVAVDIEGIDLADDSGLRFIDPVAFIPDPVVTVDGSPVIKAAAGVVIHSALHVFREIPGVPFRDRLQHPFRQDAGRAGGDRLHDIDDRHAEAGQLSLVDGGILPGTSEAVHLPAEDGIKGSILRGGNHRLELGAGRDVPVSGAGMIRVFVDDHITFTFSVGADIRQLLLNGYVPLARGGIAGIGDRGARRAG